MAATLWEAKRLVLSPRQGSPTSLAFATRQNILFSMRKDERNNQKRQPFHPPAKTHPAVGVGLYQLLQHAGEDGHERPPLRGLLGGALHRGV